MLLSGIFGRIGRSRDPDGISNDGIVGPWIPPRRRPDISWDRVADLRVAAGGQDRRQRVAGWLTAIQSTTSN